MVESNSRGQMNEFRYPIYDLNGEKLISFVKYYRTLFKLPTKGQDLRKLVVCMKVVETEDKVILIYNRKYARDFDPVKPFKYSGIWCLKLSSSFWLGLGIAKTKNLYVSNSEDGGFIISDDVSKAPNGRLVQAFGSEGYCVLPLDDYINPTAEIMQDYCMKFSDGVCVLTPLLYDDEIKLLFSGSAAYIPLGRFYDKLDKVVKDGKTYVTVRFYDKDTCIELIK